MSRPDRVLTELVRLRAAGRCEYCRLHEAYATARFHVDHIIAEKHRGTTVAENLAWACLSCNLHKGSNIAGMDPVTDQVCTLFHPRIDRWSDHFEWHGAWLRGLTDKGRTTVAVLAINHLDSVQVRASLLEEGVEP